MPRLSGRIAVYTSALLVVGVLLVPAVYALPEVGSGPGEAGRQVDDEDHTVSRAYRVIAPAYEVNTRGVGYAVWVEQDGNRYVVHGAYQSETGRWSKGRRISKAFSWGGRLEGLPGEPDVTVDDRGRATVVWAQKVGRAVKSHRSGEEEPLESPQVDLRQQRRGDVSRGGGFTRRWHALASWTGNYLTVDSMTLMANTRTRAGTWTKPRQAIPTDGTYKPSSRQPPPVIDNHGTATVAWVEVERIPTPEGFVYGRIQSATARRGGAGCWRSSTAACRPPTPRTSPSPRRRRVSCWSRSPSAARAASCGSGGALRRRCVGDAGHGVPALAGNRPPGADRGGRSGRERSDRPGDVDPDRPAELHHTAPPRVGGRPGGRLARRDRLGPGGHDRCRPRDRPGRRLRAEGRYRCRVAVRDAGSAWPPGDRRHRRPDGRWLDARSLGRFSTEPLLAIDTRGRMRALWSRGRWYVDHVNCCHALKSKRLP